MALLERAARQQGLPFTGPGLVQGFRSLQAIDLTWADGTITRRATEMTPFQLRVLQTLGWPGPEAYTALTPSAA